jgi:hypothetical protein
MTAKATMALASIMVLAVHPHTAAIAAESLAEDNRTTKIYELLDENRDGVISMAEFKTNQLLVFYVLDRNQDGALTRGETSLSAEAFARVAEADGKINSLEFLDTVDHAFTQTDANHSGTLDRQEFAALRRRIGE